MLPAGVNFSLDFDLGYTAFLNFRNLIALKRLSMEPHRHTWIICTNDTTLAPNHKPNSPPTLAITSSQEYASNSLTTRMFS